jgi:hypothetical protein
MITDCSLQTNFYSQDEMFKIFHSDAADPPLQHQNSQLSLAGYATLLEKISEQHGVT